MVAYVLLKLKLYDTLLKPLSSVIIGVGVILTGALSTKGVVGAKVVTGMDAAARECHGFVNPCGLVPRVPAGAGTGWEFGTLAQPVPMTWV